MTHGRPSAHLGRGVSLGNALDGPGAGGATLALAERHFDLLRAAGFDTVRLPVRWSAHADGSPPYRIDPAFAGLVDRAVDAALRRDLTVVVNVHHYDELGVSPAAHADRFLALWRQIAGRYAGHPDRLCLELLNEPRGAMTPPLWNRLLRTTHSAVRGLDRNRVLVVGPARMNDVDALDELDLPPDDRLVATVHYYAPFEFTHQDAPWVAGADRWRGTTWGGDVDRMAVRDDLVRAAAWADDRGHPVFLGEFGTYDRADFASRVRWTECVRSEAERLGLGWCYWDFGTDFGVFDPARDAWREPLLRALIPAPGRRAGPV